MLRHFACSILLCFATLALAQNTASANTSTSSTPVQIVYLIQGTTIVTYNIDTQTLYASQAGSLTVPNAVNNPDVYPGLISVLNGHVLYYVGFDAQNQQQLWVFATDATGSPQLPVLEEFKVTGFVGMQVDPKANFAYATFVGIPPQDSYNTPWYIRRYVIDPASGKLSQSQLAATYSLNNGAGGTTDCGLLLLGFNLGGTNLYDEVSCSAHDGSDATYNARTVNLTTGALGSDVEVYSWQNGNTGGFESVHFVAGRMFDFVVPFDYAQGYDSVNIYPVMPSTSTPLLTCNAQMLEACGYSSGVAHPSGKYIFMGIASDSTQIDKVEVSQKKIVDTGNYIPAELSAFSPDGTLVYGTQVENNGYQVPIYGFDIATSEVTPGGVIVLPSNTEAFYTAERQ
jgi:hypothetical protein